MSRYLTARCSCLLFASVMGLNLYVEAEPADFSQLKAADTPISAAQQQSNSVDAMQVSIDKQKIAVQMQIRDGRPAAPFFTTPWRALTPVTYRSPAGIYPPPQCDPLPESELAALVKETALAEGVSSTVIRAVIRRESASYPCIISPKGAVGLMQLMPATSQQFGVDANDAKQNVQAGTKFLKTLLTRYKGDVKLALAAYNAGPARVDAINAIPDIPETTAYVDAIMKDINSTKSSPDQN